VSVLDAFKAADQVLLSGVQGITDLITTPGLINLDFADVKSVMSGAGSALMGTGSSRGDDRAVAAAEMAISSPLLEASIDGAHGVLLSIQGGSDLGLFEINEAAQLVSNSAAVDANIIFGAVIDDALGDEVRVTVIAAGLDQERTGRGAASSASPAPAPAPPPAPAPRPAPSAPPAAVTRSGNGSSPAVADTSFAPVAGSILGAPVPDAGIAASFELAAEDSPAGAVADDMPEPEPARPAHPERSERPERVAMATDAIDSSSYRPAHAETAAKTFDVAATRRRPVVFEEDDDLDVPDFLK
jgi:cell division protein FtsZ